MINVDMRRAFDRVRSSAWPGETIYVVNRQGDYLIHPDRSREFGALLGKSNNWKTDFPHLASQAGTTQGIADIVPDQAARPGGIALAPALLAGVEWVGVIETAPYAVIMAPAASIRNTSLLVGAIAVLSAAVLALLIARSLTRPIVQLTEAVQRVARKGKVAIPVDARGETGVLARAFAHAVGEVNAKTAALEQEVQEHRRTVAARDHHAERERLFSAAVEILQRRHHDDVARRHHHRLELGSGAAVRIQCGGSRGREHHVDRTRRSAAGVAGRIAPDRLGRRHRSQ